MYMPGAGSGEVVGCELPTNQEESRPPLALGPRFLGVPTVARTPHREEEEATVGALAGEFIAAVGRTDGWVASKHQRGASSGSTPIGFDESRGRVNCGSQSHCQIRYAELRIGKMYLMFSLVLNIEDFLATILGFSLRL